jgi:hypothetical protein
MTRLLAALAIALLAALPGQTLQAADNSFFSGTPAPAAPTPAKPDDLAAAENALAAVWARLPYGTRHAMFVSRRADLYGGYEKRPSTTFAPGEKLLTYLETIGYGWKALDDGLFEFGVTTDFELLTAGGKVLGGQRAFQKVTLKSHFHNREFFVSLTLSVDGIGPGDYVVAYTLHDAVTEKTTRVEQPFTIKAPS